MRIGIISDSHGNTGRVRQALYEMGRVDMLFHLGDGFRDVQDIGAYHDGPVVGVRGNQDFGSNLPPSIILMLEGQRILLTHGHLQQVKWGMERLSFSAREQQVRMVCYGHTHKPACIEDSGILYVNPGSLYGPQPGYAVVRIIRNKIIPALCPLQNADWPRSKDDHQT